jgi:pimeloyl-ACP methyl ester carboxylesterase
MHRDARGRGVKPWVKVVRNLATMLVIIAAIFLLSCQSLVRSALFYPTHVADDKGLTRWMHDATLIGFARPVADPANVWLLLHGNGGQASDRVYLLKKFSERDAVFILEYPGYGTRPGTPSRKSFDAAALEAYQVLRAQFPGKPVCVVTESIGSGPGSTLARAAPAPDKLVLIVPFDVLKSVAHEHVPYLPTSLMLAGSWDNVESLAAYAGPIEVFGAERDPIIPVEHARKLAASRPQAKFHLVPGGHMDWVDQPAVQIRNP